MSVSYVSAGQSIRVTQLNALTAELDKALRCLFADKSFYVYDHGRTLLEGERFYFGDSGSWRLISQLWPAATEYDHTTFETAAAAFTVDAYHNDTETADTTQADPWPLDGSLEAHTTEDSGTTYFWRQDKDGAGDYGKRECYRRFAVAEIIIEGLGSSTWTWDTKYDKYHFLRFHNFDLTTLTITLPGGSTVVVPPLGLRAVRRVYPATTTWDTSYVYLWAARSGDWLCWDSVPENNVASIKSFHTWLDSFSARTGYLSPPGRPCGAPPGFHIDPTEVWDGSALLPQAIAGSTEVFKYEKHLGDLVVYEDAGSGTPIRTLESPTWTSLIAGTGTIKLNVSTGSVPHVLTLQADTGATTPVDVFAKGSTIMRRWPDTMPHTLTSTFEGVGEINAPDNRTIAGVEQLSYSQTHSYITQPGFVNVDVLLEVDTNYYGTGSAAWTTVSTSSIWSDLDDVATLESGSATEQTSAPTITWKSDGWRLVACATTDIPISLQAWPIELGYNYPDLGLAEVDSGGFAVRCGGDALGRDTWDITSRTYGRKLSDYVGYKSGGSHFYTGHPDISGGDDDPLADGIEMTESRVAPEGPGTTRLESVGITASNTLTLPVYPTADIAERLAADDSAAAYAANRAGWKANTLTDADLETVVRMPILGMHYNHVAQRLNGLYTISPYTHEYLWWYGQLEDGVYTMGQPPDLHCGVLSTGSRADAIGLTVLSETINGTTQYYITQTDVAAWCATYGIRYFCLRLSALADWNSGNESLSTSYSFREDNTQPYRWRGQLYAYVYRTVDVDDGSTRGPVAIGGTTPNDPTEGAMLELEHVQEDGTAPPTGWELQTTNYVLTWTNDVIHYDNDPLSAASLAVDEEPFDVYTADAHSPAIWDAADLPQYITCDDVDALYSGSGAGSRAFYRLILLPRFFFRRT